MNRRRFIVGIGFACLSARSIAKATTFQVDASDTAAGNGSERPVYQRSAKALGTTVSLRVVHPSPQVASQALDAAFAQVERIEKVMSLFRPESQINQLNHSGTLRAPDPDLIEILTLARQIARLSRGAFDITVQPLWELYAQSILERGDRDAFALPPLELQRALAKIGWQRIFFDTQRVRLTRPGAAITLNGIAQGFATDRIASTLRNCGIQHALIDAGELSALGNKPEQRAWRVGIQHPRQPDAYIALAELSDRCLATSGDYESTFSDDFRVHHILDPRTGACPRELASVSVVAPTAALADALSTTIMVLGAEQGERLLRHFPGTDMLVIDKMGRCRHTNGFPAAGPPARGELPVM